MTRRSRMLVLGSALLLLGCNKRGGESLRTPAQPEPMSASGHASGGVDEVDEVESANAADSDHADPLDEPAPAPAPTDTAAQVQALKAEIADSVPTLTACYEDELQRDSSLAGKMRYTIVIETGGWVSEVMIDEDSVGSEAVRACVVERIRSWSFVDIALDEAVELSFAVNYAGV